jgi:hypothetical protein
MQVEWIGAIMFYLGEVDFAREAAAVLQRQPIRVLARSFNY